MSVEIIPFRPELTPQLLELQTKLWGADRERNAAYFRWKYLDSPYAGEPLIHLAISQGKVIGMRGMFATCWEAGGADRQLLPYADDLVVDEAFRNQGVVRQLMEANFAGAAARGFRCCLSLSAGSVTYLSSLAAGWRTVGDYQPVTYDRAAAQGVERGLGFIERRVSSRAEGKLRRLLQRSPFARLDRVGPTAPEPGGSIVLSLEARPEAMADLVARLPWDGRIRHVRDAGYFGWRFRNPMRQYRFLFRVDTAGAVQGYLVLNQRLGEAPGPQRVSLVDWEGDEQVRADLLDAAMRWGRFDHLVTWTVNLTEPGRALLRNRGFEPLPPKDHQRWRDHMLVRSLSPGAEAATWGFGTRDLRHLTDWDLRQLYSMSG